MFFTVIRKGNKKLKYPFTVHIGTFLDNNLVKAEAYVVKAHILYVYYVFFRNISFKMLHITDSYGKSPLLRQNIESFVVCEPSAYSHTFGEIFKSFHYNLPSVAFYMHRISTLQPIALFGEIIIPYYTKKTNVCWFSL